MNESARNWLHAALLLTEKPGEWAPWLVAPLALLTAAATGLAWDRATGDARLAWSTGLGLLALAAADWALLASLPRRGLSFGAVQPPWLALTILRGALALATLPLAGRWPLPSLVLLALVQLGIWVLLAQGTTIEPFRLQISHLELPSVKISNPGPPVRIVQLSDLHVERLTRRDRALPALVAGLAPDLIVLTGDFLNTSYNRDPRALADLRQLLAGLQAPGGIYAVWGTAEVDRPELLRPLLSGLGISVLEDQAVAVTVGKQQLYVVGLRCSRDLDAEEARLRTLLAGAAPGALTLLLYHMPDLMPRAAKLGVDLFLAGHTHGGQWRLPGFGAILTSSRYGKRYEGGYYREGKTDLYVSRGLGLEGFGTPRARFFCPPEIVSISLKSHGQPSLVRSAPRAVDPDR
jgi:predicted MPP superfamily phosphohydrolase